MNNLHLHLPVIFMLTGHFRYDPRFGPQPTLHQQIGEANAQLPPEQQSFARKTWFLPRSGRRKSKAF